MHTITWLYWMTVLGLREVSAQGNSGESNSSSSDSKSFEGGASRFGGDGRGGRRFRHRPGFRKGGRFGKGRKGRLQDGDQSGEGDDEEGVETAELAPTATFTSLLTSNTSVAVDTTTSIAFLDTTTNIAAVSSLPTETFVQPASVADAFPESQSISATLLGIPYAVPSTSTRVASSSSIPAPEPTSFPALASPFTTTRLTVTSSKTVFVTSPPAPSLTSITSPPEVESPVSIVATQSPSLDLAPLPASSVKPLSSGEKAGIAIGILFVVLTIVGAIVYALHRRRRNNVGERLGSQAESQHGGTERRSLALADFFGPLNKGDQRTDPDWSIESAEKISIIRAGSVKSVESQPRAVTPPLPSHLPSGPSTVVGRNGTEVLKVGMTFPERKPTPRLADMALRSNPPVSPGLFPNPPRGGKTGNWPLPD